MRRASREGWTWGAKTVRGAYMHVERARAAQLGYDSPIQDSIAATHSNYNRCGRLLTLQARAGLSSAGCQWDLEHTRQLDTARH